jgi:hypothetical protein
LGRLVTRGIEPSGRNGARRRSCLVDEQFETIRASRHTSEEDFSGGVFGELVSPEEAACCRRPEFPAVAIDPNGDIAVVWQEEIGSSGETGVYTSFRPHDGSFSSPLLISPGTKPDVAIDASGEEIVSWVRDDGASAVVEVATAQSGGTLSVPTPLSGDGGDAADVQISADSVGDAIVSWTRSLGPATELEAAVRTAGGSFPAPDGEGDGAKLGATDANAAAEPPRQRVAIDSAGEALAVWEAPGGAVQEARLTSPRASFGAPTTLGTTSAFPSLAMNETGEGVVDWPVQSAIDVATAPAGGDFGAIERVATEGTPALAEVSIAPSGALALAWLKNATESAGCREISEYGSVRPPGGTFTQSSGIITACGPTGLASRLQLVGDSAGDALAIWQESTTLGENVRGFVYDVGPTLGAVAIPTSARVGESVSFGMTSPISVWRPVTATTWSFGDGATASGLTAAHTYTQSGEYHVTASAADAQLLAPGFPERHIENSVSETIFVSPSPGPATPLGIAAAARVAPAIAHVRESHRAWSERAARRRGKELALGTTFSFTLNEQANVRFAFTRLPAKCSAPAHSRHRRACPRPIPAGSLSIAGHRGADTLHFHGRLPSTRWLAPGSYAVAITAANGAGRSPTTSLRFTIVR